MALNNVRSLNHIIKSMEVLNVAGVRAFSAGAKAKKGAKAAEATDTPKKGAKGAAATDDSKTLTLSKEVKATTVVGANILKEGADPKIMADSEYPDWLWHVLDKRPALSELQRQDAESLSFQDLKRFVKLDNRARIKESNSVRAK